MPRVRNSVWQAFNHGKWTENLLYGNWIKGQSFASEKEALHMQSIIVHWRAKPCRHFIEHAVGAIPAHCGALPSVQCGAEGGQGEARKLCSAITGRLLLRGTDTATLALYRKTARSWHPCLPASRSGGAPGRHCHHGCAPSPSVAPLLPLPVALARASARVHGWRVGLRLRAAAAALAVSRLCRCSMPPPLQWPSCRVPGRTLLTSGVPCPLRPRREGTSSGANGGWTPGCEAAARTGRRLFSALERKVESRNASWPVR
jgi:hypothetical protein